MASEDMSKKRLSAVDETDAIALHVAGATVRHRSPFEELIVPRNAEELPDDLVERWVVPFYRAWLGSCQAPDVQRFAASAREINVGLVRALLGEFDWRPRIAAAHFAAINGYRELEDILGTHLLKSEVCFAGTGYCLALVSFGTAGAKRYLLEYLDYYLGRADLWFDQATAFCALERLDPAAAEKLQPRWREYTADKETLKLDDSRANFARALDTLEAIQCHSRAAAASTPR